MTPFEWLISDLQRSGIKLGHELMESPSGVGPACVWQWIFEGKLIVVDLQLIFLEPFRFFVFTFYHGKSQLSHHLGNTEYYVFPSILCKSKNLVEMFLEPFLDTLEDGPAEKLQVMKNHSELVLLAEVIRYYRPVLKLRTIFKTYSSLLSSSSWNGIRQTGLFFAGAEDFGLFWEKGVAAILGCSHESL